MKMFLLFRKTVFLLLLSVSTVFGIRQIDFVRCYQELRSSGDIENFSDLLIGSEIYSSCDGDISKSDEIIVVDIIRRMDFIEKNTSYRFESKINQGLEKVIFKTESNEAIALFFDIPIRIDSFDNEIHFLTELNHDNIIKIRDVNREEFYFVQDLAEMDLLDFIDLVDSSRTGLPDDDIDRVLMEILKDVASALCYLRSNNIVHRDIKPENILLFEDGDGSYTAKIIDFSFAVQIPENSEKLYVEILRGSFFTTPPLVWTEVYDSSTSRGYHCSCSDDIYALAIVFYMVFYLRHVRYFYKQEYSIYKQERIRLKKFVKEFRFFYIDFLNRDNRPPLSDDNLLFINELISDCWQTNSSNRPTPEDLVVRLRRWLITDARYRED